MNAQYSAVTAPPKLRIALSVLRSTVKSGPQRIRLTRDILSCADNEAMLDAHISDLVRSAAFRV